MDREFTNRERCFKMEKSVQPSFWKEVNLLQWTTKNQKTRKKLLSNKAVPTLYLLINSTAKLSNSSEVEILKSAIEKDHSCTSRKTNIPGIESANENFERYKLYLIIIFQVLIKDWF